MVSRIIGWIQSGIWLNYSIIYMVSWQYKYIIFLLWQFNLTSWLHLLIIYWFGEILPNSRCKLAISPRPNSGWRETCGHSDKDERPTSSTTKTDTNVSDRDCKGFNEIWVYSRKHWTLIQSKPQISRIGSSQYITENFSRIFKILTILYMKCQHFNFSLINV